MWKRFDDSVSYSRRVSALSDRAYRVWTMNLVHTDGRGRFLDDPVVVRAKALPLVQISIEEVAAALDELARGGSIHRYEANGLRYAVYHDHDEYNPPSTLRFRTGTLPPPPTDLCRCASTITDTKIHNHQKFGGPPRTAEDHQKFGGPPATRHDMTKTRHDTTKTRQDVEIKGKVVSIGKEGDTAPPPSNQKPPDPPIGDTLQGHFAPPDRSDTFIQMLVSMTKESGLIGLPSDARIARELTALIRRAKISEKEIQSSILQANGTGWFEWLKFWTDRFAKSLPPRLRGAPPAQ